jgi:hypothetical protein
VGLIDEEAKSMIRKSGYRFSEKIMLKQESGARWRFNLIPARCSMPIMTSMVMARHLRRSAKMEPGPSPAGPALSCRLAH